MDGIAFLILLALAIPVMAIAGFVMALSQRSRLRMLEGHLAVMLQRLTQLEAQATHGASPAKARAPETAAAREAKPEQSLPPRDEAPKAARVPEDAAPVPAEPRRGLEEMIGARGAVWVGGLALALGGIFMVRYSIEQGLIGPAARTALGGLFALALIGAGECLRRREDRSAVAGIPAAHIPGILTAAGTTAAFATTYAAYALYGFLPPALAFVALAVVAVGTMLAAALHGPLLAALGLVASTALPALVSSEEPNAWALFIHLAFVSAAAFGVARIRGWTWLMLAAGGAAFAWGALYTVGAAGDSDTAALAAFSAAMMSLAALYHLTAPLREEEAARMDRPSSAVAAAFGLFAVPVALSGDHAAAALVLMVMLVALEAGLGVWRRRLAALVPAAAVTALLGVASFDLAPWLLADPTTAFPMPGQPGALPTRIGDLFATALALAAIIGGLGLNFAWRQPDQPMWITGARTGGGVAAPLLLLAVAYWKVAALAPDLRFAGAAVALAGAFVFLADRFARREAGHPFLTAATAAMATGAVAAIGLALAMGMREGFLTLSLAVLALGIAWVHGSRRIAALPVLAMITGAIVLARTGLDPLLVAHDIGATPVFNALLWAYGLPAAAFVATAWLFARQDAPRATGLFEALALLFTALLLAFEIRHFTTGGRLADPVVSLPEIGLQVMTGCLVAIGAQRLSAARHSRVLRAGSLLIGVLAMIGGVQGLLFGVNPMFTRDSIGEGLVFNDLLPGYLLPALAAAGLAVQSRRDRPHWYVTGAGILSGLLAFAWVTLEVRAAFHRPVIADGITSPAEWYSYSVAWLACGVALLLAGAWTGSRALRLGSAAVIVLTVLKVFLLDMNDLEGVLRALSFMGLGLALVGIGLLYQRLLFPASRASA